MSKKSKREKICGLKKNETCYNCANRISITEKKDKIVVVCKLYNSRTLHFVRRISINPYCGAYKPNDRQ